MHTDDESKVKKKEKTVKCLEVRKKKKRKTEQLTRILKKNLMKPQKCQCTFVSTQARYDSPDLTRHELRHNTPQLRPNAEQNQGVDVLQCPSDAGRLLFFYS